MEPLSSFTLLCPHYACSVSRIMPIYATYPYLYMGLAKPEDDKLLLHTLLIRYNLGECAYSSVDRASVFGTEGRGFESL